MPIYAGARNKFLIDKTQDIGPTKLHILGYSGAQKVHIDSLHQTRAIKISPEEEYKVNTLNLLEI